MNHAIEDPLIIFYNPECAKQHYQRLPAAILQVASFIETEFSFEIIDGNLREVKDYAELICSKISSNGTKYLAISVMPGPQLVSSLRDIRHIKQRHPDITIIVGGYFPLNHYEVCARDKDIDYVVKGPGENSFRNLIVALENRSLPDTVTGIAFERDGELIVTRNEAAVHPDQLPRYPYHYVDVEKYVLPTFLGRRTLSHHSSFGCPFFCNFCSVVALADGKWMGENGARLGALVNDLVDRWNIDAFEFHDNNFFTSEKRVVEFCNQLKNRNIQLSWWGEGRADTLLKYKDSTWQLMNECGLKMIFLGAESGDDETLARMNKGGTQSSAGVLSLVEKMRRYNVIPELSFILGNPPNPVLDMKKTIQFIRLIKKVNPEAEIIMYRYDPVPIGGEMYDQVTAMGFRFPTTLEEWASPKWRKIQRRTSADVPWLQQKEQQFLSDFQTVLNAYYPTATSRHIKRGSWRYWLLKMVSGVRYHSGIYRYPSELKWLQKKLHYQRPEISGF
jgi:anaerobic magnesium-protoporphyrin IX monomethyl ester cyclase